MIVKYEEKSKVMTGEEDKEHAFLQDKRVVRETIVNILQRYLHRQIANNISILSTVLEIGSLLKNNALTTTSLYGFQQFLPSC